MEYWEVVLMEKKGLELFSAPQLEEAKVCVDNHLRYLSDIKAFAAIIERCDQLQTKIYHRLAWGEFDAS